MPQVCSLPGPHGPGSDCGLWPARERIALQRSIAADGAARLTIGAAVWADMNRRYQRPGSLPTRPPVPAASPEPPAVEASSSIRAGLHSKKGVSSHA